MILALAGLVFIFSLATEHFFSWTTLRTIANQIPYSMIIAIGMTFVLIVAEIDLSVGSVLALSSAVFGVCLVDYGLPLFASISACLAVGLICGGFSGLITVRWKLPSFITTLGMLEMARGGAYIVTNSETKYLGNSVNAFANASVFGLSLSFFIALIAVTLGQVVLTRTIFGRYMIAIGTNEEAVRLSGINTRLIKVVVFLLSGLLSSIAAVIHSSRLSAVDPNAGTGFELNAIASVVIGGTSIMGGRGSVIRSFFGVLIIAVLSSGLVQIGAREPAKRLITGGVIVAAVILDYYRTRLKQQE
ncbi:ABC transporter permease [bacterium]|nr:ABC transporter permease [bacterium]